MPELALTERESRRLKALEDTIRKSAGDMYDAMRAIHDEKLYRDEFSTWEEYCRGRWGMSPQYANRLIEHGKVLALLSDDPKSETIVSLSEAATREVAALPDKQKVKVLRQVAKESSHENNGKPKVTAAAVREKVQRITTTAKPENPPKTTEISVAKMVDGLMRDHVSPLVRGIDEVAAANGGKGIAHVCANDALNDLIAALKRMRGGER